MTSPSNNCQPLIVTIYTYIVYGLYKVTILSLLRVSIYIKLLYGGWVIDVSKSIDYLPSLFSTLHPFSKTFQEFSRLISKTNKSQSFMSFASQHMCRDVSRAVNEL